jgi:hypothetical protein
MAVAGARATHRLWHSGWEGIAISVAITLGGALMAALLMRAIREKPALLIWMASFFLALTGVLATIVFWRTGRMSFIGETILVGSLVMGFLIYARIRIAASTRPRNELGAGPT